MLEAFDEIQQKHEASKDDLLSRMNEEESTCIREYASIPKASKGMADYH